MRAVVVGALIGSLLTGPVMASEAPTCGAASAKVGCPTSIGNTGESVELGASRTDHQRAPGAARKPGRPSNPNQQTEPTMDPSRWTTGTDWCGAQPVPCGGPVATPPAAHTVTLEDLASFRPAAPELQSEPDGIGVAGLPVNLVGSASTQEIPGTLFDFAVTVRFTPAQFRFDYGDGAVTTTATGGTSWAVLRAPQFTPTATSHTYRAPGTYRASLSVQYTAAVDFGSGWIPVDGYVTASGGGHGIRIFEARTALVGHTCDQTPHGPGC